MNVSYKWLKEYVDFNMTPDEVAKALTSVGLEVEAVEEVQSIRGGLKGLVVEEVEPRRNSRLNVVTSMSRSKGTKERVHSRKYIRRRGKLSGN